MSHSTRIVLHIGMHKTGSTAIQRHLRKHSRALSERGILIPKSGREGRESVHYRLAWSVVVPERRQLRGLEYEKRRRLHGDRSAWMALSAELESSNAPVAVLTCEDFWWASPDEINRIHELLAPHPVQIIMYVRNHLAFAVSAYKQGVKRGRIREGITGHTIDRLWMFDYDATIRRWTSVFGANAFHLRLYDAAKDSLVADFLSTAGLGSPIEGMDEQHNVSLSDGVIRLLRFLNRMEGGDDRKAWLHRIRRNVLMERRPGRSISSLAEMFLRRPVASDRFVQEFRLATEEMRQRFLATHVAPEGRHHFDF